jgi:hypothetical protein
MTLTNKAITEAYRRGRKAFEAKIPPTANPYKGVDYVRACQWLDGYIDARLEESRSQQHDGSSRGVPEPGSLSARTG